VVQWNKRDIEGVLSPAELRAALNRRGAPEFETVASRGEGTMEALKEITRLVVAALKTRPPPRRPGPEARPTPDPGQAAPRGAAPAAQGPSAPGPSAPGPSTGAPPAAAATRAPASKHTPMPRSSTLSFARLFPGSAAGVVEVEQALRDGRFGAAIKAAAQGVSDVLASLEVDERSDTARAALLGVDGRDYLRLLRLSRLPEDMGSEADALFALHVLVSVKLRADAI